VLDVLTDRRKPGAEILPEQLVIGKPGSASCSPECDPP
jgi:hypothetical protein